MALETRTLYADLKFPDKDRLIASCQRIAKKRSMTIRYPHPVEIGSAFELTFNSNEILGDRYDDFVLHGICVKKDGKKIQLIFSSLPEMKIFRVPKSIPDTPRILPHIAAIKVAESSRKKRQYKKLEDTSVKEILSRIKDNPKHFLTKQLLQPVPIATLALLMMILSTVVFFSNPVAIPNELSTMPKKWQQTQTKAHYHYTELEVDSEPMAS